MIEFTMPALGADMDEGRLEEWRIKPGDTVTRGQIVAVVETTKAAVEIECWNDGVVDRLLVPVGETVAVGTPLATLLEPGERPGAASASTPVRTPPAGPSTTESPQPQHVSGLPAPVGHRLWVSPVARRTAAALGIDLKAVTGTGPQGAVTLHDVEHAAATAHHEAPKPAPAPPTSTPTGAAPKSAAEKARERGAAMRASIAAAMSRSKREIPHYYLADEINLDSALTWLTERNAGRPITERILPAVLQLKAVACATRKVGELNGFWRDDHFEPADQTHVGVAISLRGGGLVAPAIHDVAEKPLSELMADLTDLVARARAGSLRSSEMSDPTITVTNLGENGVDSVFGVIYPPQVAIVGFGRPAQRVVAVDGGIRVATTVHSSLAADHRASDGARGALFLAEVNRLLQQPQDL
ncbi:MAG: 2-oxo acid dehydrogenase subunit E2 [Mycobacterium sp.]|nr:2-oxo acid dehydrogenase subunit E2 [Mycobacterium sp.]